MTEILVHNTRLIADPSGALYWPEERLLIVADMHLEKGSAFAAKGQMLPPYDSALTLANLEGVLAHYKPQRLIALGDSFHDTHAMSRMAPVNYDALTTLAGSVETVWITGNHDPEIPAMLPGERMCEMRISVLTFRHEPLALAQPGEVAGHLHPAAKVVTERGRVRRRCFVSDGERLLMPAFGAYAGGLNVRDPAIASLFQKGAITAHVCGKAKVYSVRSGKLSPD
jgi:uncharacterized protein